METLEISYDFNKTLIAGSDYWNNVTKSIELCQVVQLVHETTSGLAMVIQEDMRNVTIDFTLFANFTIDVNFTGADIQAVNDTTDLSGYITAFHCDGEDAMNELQAGTKLRPNDVLNVCIVSSSTDVEIARVTTMVIKGFAPGGVPNELPVLVNSGAAIPAITSSRFVNATSFVLSTRVPVNSFDYEVADAFIDIEGSLIMNFRGSSGSRTLMASAVPKLRNLQTMLNKGEGSFELSINLEPESEIQDKIALVTSESKSVSFIGTLATIGTALAMHAIML